MPKSKKSRCEFSFEEELVADIVTEEVNPNFIYAASPGDVEEEEDVPRGEPEQLSRVVLDVIEKEEIVETDIFDLVNNMSSEGESVMIEDEPAKKPPIVRKVKDNDEAQSSHGPAPLQPQKLTKKGKTRKPMSDAHKAKLVLAREKANAVRKKNALLRKEQRDLDKDNKDLAKELKRKEAGILKKQRLEAVRALDGPPAAAPTGQQPSKPSDFEGEREYKNNKLDEQYLQQQQPAPSPSPSPARGQAGRDNLTRKDLEDAQFDAIMKYESLRKERKAEKKQKEMIERQQADLKQKINNFGYGSKAPNGRLVNRWDSCY